VGDTLGRFVKAAGCALVRDEDPGDSDWPNRCLLSRVLRGLVRGNKGRLLDDREWLRAYYRGRTSYFDEVTAVDKSKADHSRHRSPSPVFDVVVHLRTIGLIEDPHRHDHLPADPEGQSRVFLNSPAFQAMVQCTASEVAYSLLWGVEDGVAVRRENEAVSASLGWHGVEVGKSGPRKKVKPVHGPQGRVAIFLATDAALVREPLARQLSEAVAHFLNNATSAQGVTKPWDKPQGSKRLPKSRGGSQTGRSLQPQDQDRFQRAKARRALREDNFYNQSHLKLAHQGALDMAKNVEVDVSYFDASLPPAHFQLWNKNMDEVSPRDWQALVGTTVEWLFLGSARRMLTIKGLKGGERARPSSFALSAAAFGRTEWVTALMAANYPQCKWKPISSFQ